VVGNERSWCKAEWMTQWISVMTESKSCLGALMFVDHDVERRKRKKINKRVATIWLTIISNLFI